MNDRGFFNFRVIKLFQFQLNLYDSCTTNDKPPGISQFDGRLIPKAENYLTLFSISFRLLPNLPH